MPRVPALVCLCIALLVTPALGGVVDGNKAADDVAKKLSTLGGFTATYRGESETSDARPELTVGYGAPDRLYIQVPMMAFTASHENAVIRIVTGSEAVVMPLSEVRDLSADAHQGFAKLPWLGIPDPKTSPMHAKLNLEMGDRTLNIGISFGESKDPFSWLGAMRSKKAKVTAEDGVYRASLPKLDGGAYVYVISRKTGVLEKLIDEKDGKESRVIALTELTEQAPAPATFSQVGAMGKAERFGSSPDQRAQYLIGLYSGLQEAILQQALPRWKTLSEKEKKDLIQSVATYWSVVYKNIFISQKGQLEVTLGDPKFKAMVEKKASDKQAFAEFKTALPETKKDQAGAMWVDRVLGALGYEMLDPFVAWTRGRYIEPAKKHLEENGPKHGLDAKEQERFLAAISLPIIDACYVAAEPIVLPKLLPMIRTAASPLEGS